MSLKLEKTQRIWQDPVVSKSFLNYGQTHVLNCMKSPLISDHLGPIYPIPVIIFNKFNAPISS